MRARAVALAAVLAFVSGVQDVGAFQNHAHSAISQGAVNELKFGGEAPDMAVSFAPIIIENSGGQPVGPFPFGEFTPEIKAHGGPGGTLLHWLGRNGGPFDEWVRLVLEDYKSQNFNRAYTEVGYLVHLMEDQHSPLHAANVSHGAFDKFEGQSNDISVPSLGQGIEAPFNVSASGLLDFYKAKVASVRGMVPNYIHPSRQKPYWIAGNQPYDGLIWAFDGHYGLILPPKTICNREGFCVTSTPEFDIYDSASDPYDVISVHTKLAVRRAAGLLLGLSKLLPPLVDGASISPENWPGSGLLTLTARVLENRKSQIRVTAEIFDSSGASVRKPYNLQPFTLDPGSLLPWEKELSLAVDAAGLTEGAYTLKLTIRDFDDNDSEAVTVGFFVDGGGPDEDVEKPNGDAIPPGASIFHDRCITVSGSDTGSGICSISLSGPINASASFKGQKKARLGPYCPGDLPDGCYTTTVTDCAGRTTTRSFCINGSGITMTLTTPRETKVVAVDKTRLLNARMEIRTEVLIGGFGNPGNPSLVCLQTKLSPPGACVCEFAGGGGYCNLRTRAKVPAESTGFSVTNTTTSPTFYPIGLAVVLFDGQGEFAGTSTALVRGGDQGGEVLAPGQSVSGTVEIEGGPTLNVTAPPPSCTTGCIRPLSSASGASPVFQATVISPIRNLDNRLISLPPGAQTAAASQGLVSPMFSSGFEILLSSAVVSFQTPASIGARFSSSLTPQQVGCIRPLVFDPNNPSPCGSSYTAEELASLSLFRFDGGRWEPISSPGQGVSIDKDAVVTVASVPFTLSGLIAPFYRRPDRLAPVTTLSLGEPQAADGRTVSPFTPLTLASVDDAQSAGDRLGWGTARMQYAIDSGPFTLYLGTFSVSGDGPHSVRFFSVDHASNTETIRSVSLIVDGTAPSLLEVSADGSNPSPWSNEGGYFISVSTPSDPSGVVMALGKACAAPQGPGDGAQLDLASQPMFVSPSCLNEGSNPLFFWGMDGVGNNDFRNAAQLDLRYDSVPPASSALSPSTAAAGPIVVSFAASDPGADSLPQMGSGLAQLNLWWRKDDGGDGVFGTWNTASASSGAATGQFLFPPVGDGQYHFYTQGHDVAGNLEPPPVATSTQKTETFFDGSQPVIAGVVLPLISASRAQVAWTTDDETRGVVEYGTTTALGHSQTTPSGRRHLAELDCSLLSPATIYYRVTATNRTGLAASSALSSFATPPLVTAPIDIFGVIDPSMPIDVQVTNPSVMSATFTVDGQSASVVFSTATGFQIFLDTAATGIGVQTLRIVLDGFTYETQFIVDTATRSVRLSRTVLAAAGVATDSAATPGSSAVEMTLGEAAGETMSGPGSRVQLGYFASIDPVAPSAVADLAAAPGPGAGQVSLAWTAVGDDAAVGTAMKYDLRRSTSPITDEPSFAAADRVEFSTFPAPAGSLQGAVVGGLADGTTYHFALRVLDELLNASPPGASVQVRTLDVVRSAEATNGFPTVEFLSFVPGVTITQVSTTTTETAVALATSAAAAQSLLFYSTMFDIVSPDPSLPGGATVQFRYQDPGDPTLEASLRLYEFKESLNQWILVADVGPDAARDLFFLPIPGLSFYAVMYRDATPPATSLELRGGRQFIAGSSVFASTASTYGLIARDPSQGGFPGSGVARSEFRLDSPSASFEVLPVTGTIAPPPGAHTIQFRSVDRAGNVESIRSAVIRVDVAAPTVTLTADAPFRAAADGLTVVGATATVTVVLRDTLLPDTAGIGAGVESVSYRLDGGSLAVAALPSFQVQLGLGEHSLGVVARDQVGNVFDNMAAPFRVLLTLDALPPRTTVEFGVPHADAGIVYVTSATPIVLRSIDDLLQLGDGAGVGVSAQEVSVVSLSSGSVRSLAFAAGVSQLSLSQEAEGLYALSFLAEDRQGNREAARGVTAGIDHTAPATVLRIGSPRLEASGALLISPRTLIGLEAFDPAVNGSASGVAATELGLDGSDFAVVQGSFSLSGGTHTLAFFSRDKLGLREAIQTSSLTVDALAPLTNFSLSGPSLPLPFAVGSFPSDVDVFVSSRTSVLLAGAEQGAPEESSGLALTRYALDGSPYEVYRGSFVVDGEGIHGLSFQSVDLVQNEEPLRSMRIAVDTTPPVSLIAVNGSSYTDSGGRVYVASAAAVGLVSLDPISSGVASGPSSLEFRVDAASSALFAEFLSTFTLAPGLHRVEGRSRDQVGNVELPVPREVFVDVQPPASGLAVGAAAPVSSGDLIVTEAGALLRIASTDPDSDGGASGVRETLVAIDSGAFSAVAGSFTLPGEESRVVRFFARDNVGNEEQVRSVRVVFAVVRPTATLFSPSPAAVGVDKAFGQGLVPVVASVSSLHLSSYTVEFAAGTGAQSGFAVISVGTAPVTRGVAAQWDTTTLSGFYTLRLRVHDALGPVSVSTATVYIGDLSATLVIRNQENNGKDKLLDKPEGVAVDEDGSIFVANTGKDQVLKFGPQGSLLAAFDGRTLLVRNGDGREPDDDRADKGRKDKGNRSNDGDKSERKDEQPERGEPESITFQKPTGLAIDDAANLYVADRNNNRIVILSSTGTVLRSLGRSNSQGRFVAGKGAGEFNKPTGVAVSASRIAVADRNNGRVQVFGRDFAFLYQIKLDEAAPGGVQYREDDDDEESATFAVAWSPGGELYVTDEGNDRALVFDPQGDLLAVIGSRGESAGQFRRPKGVDVSPLSYLYVADRGNKRAQKFDPFRNAVLATGNSLGLEQPTGLTSDGAGSLYIADRKMDRVLRLGLPASGAVASVPPSGKVKKGRLSSRGGKVVRADRVTVDVPAGALAEELEISIEPEKKADPEEEQRKERAKEQKKLAAVSEGVEYGPEGTNFNAPVTITLVYDPKQLPRGVREEDLKVHYWNPSKGEWEEFPSTVDKELRTVSAKTMHFSLYQIMGPGTGNSAAPLADASFGVKAGYVFPNPVRGQRTVTFRLQPGVADSVAVRVYDLSGRKVHESSAFTDRGAFDDGNGLGAQFTYDHVWDVSGVGSGVYTYVLVARRAGQSDVRKTGKVAVVK